MTINGKITTVTIGGERSHTHDHPPVVRSGKVKSGNGIYDTGLILMRDENQLLIPYVGGVDDQPCGVCDGSVNTSEQSTCPYLVHGTAKERLLKLASNSAPESADIIKLETLGIYPV